MLIIIRREDFLAEWIRVFAILDFQGYHKWTVHWFDLNSHQLSSSDVNVTQNERQHV